MKCFGRLMPIMVAYLILLSFQDLKAQDESVQGYVIALSDGKVTLDLTLDQVTKGDLVRIVKAGEIIIHPVTGESIQKKDETISNITLTEVAASYSVGEAYPSESFELLKVGMKAFVMEERDIEESMIKKFVVIPPMNIVGGPKGMLGSYMSDLLAEELFNLDRFRILDRETFDLQQFELGLKKEGTQSKTTGVDYLVVGSAFPPDVVVKSTGVPLKGIVTAATGGQSALITQNLMSDLKVQELQALVKFTLKVIDVSTGEVIFICSEMAKAEGKSQVNLESGVLGGVTLNGGATDFKNTITGKASETALTNSAKYVADFFEGKIKTKNFQGTIIELKKGKKKDRGEDLTIMDIRQEPGQAPIAVVGGGSDHDVVKNHSFLITLPKESVSSITGKKKITGVNKVGMITITEVDFDASLADIKGVVPGRDLMNNIIYKGRMMHYCPLRMTLGSSIYGVWSDALFMFDMGLEYFPNVKDATWINSSVWLGARFNYGSRLESDSEGLLVYVNDWSSEFIIGVNPLKKKFDYQTFDPYLGVKYKIIHGDLGRGGPEVFMGLGFGALFAEIGVGWGPHGDAEMMRDATIPKEITGWGFNRLGANIGYRFNLNRLAF